MLIAQRPITPYAPLATIDPIATAVNALHTKRLVMSN